MLGLSALTAGTLAAGATGTLAWFTTNKTATATYNNITAQGTTSALKISIAGVTQNTTVTQGTADNIASATGGMVSDVSSKNGINFYQPDWKGNSGNGDAVEFNSILDVTKKPGYFVQYMVTVSLGDETADTNKYDFSLTEIKITAASDTANNLANWTRVAINTVVENDTDNHILKEGTDNVTYLFQNVTTNDSDKKYVNPLKEGHGNTMKSVLDSCEPRKASDVNSTTAKITAEAWKGKTQTDKSVTLGVSVWMEGTIADNQNNAKNPGESVSVSLTFSAEVVK